MVLPAGGASRIAREALEREAGEPGEAPLYMGVPARFVDQAKRLVKPDGDARAHAQDQSASDPRFRLRQRSGTRVLPIAWMPQMAPVPGEVAVEVDPPSILPDPGGRTIGIQVVDHPHKGIHLRGARVEATSDRRPRPLVAVDAANHQELPGGVWITDGHSDHRPPSYRSADDRATMDQGIE
jgi:hypothetical protein